jgi:hypothetical protein
MAGKSKYPKTVEIIDLINMIDVIRRKYIRRIIDRFSASSLLWQEQVDQTGAAIQRSASTCVAPGVAQKVKYQ